MIGYGNQKINYQHLKNHSNTLFVFLPGVGYKNDYPLMYYIAKYAQAHSYDMLRVDYNYKENGFLNETSEVQNEWISEDMSAIIHYLSSYEYNRVVWVAKSLGTLLLALSKDFLQNDLAIKHQSFLWLTPLFSEVEVPNAMSSLQFPSLYVIGTEDPYYSQDVIEQLLSLHHLKGVVIDHADHSLEDSSPLNSIQNLQKVLKETVDFLDKDVKGVML